MDVTSKDEDSLRFAFDPFWGAVVILMSIYDTIETNVGGWGLSRMGMANKLDPELAQRLKEFLRRNHISTRRIVVDVENESFEVEQPKETAGIPDNQHILDAMGILSEQEATRITQEVRRERDGEWN